MNLKEFISEALVQIQEGVQDAINRRANTPGSAGVINPVWGSSSDISSKHQKNVDFDVAITVIEATSAQGAAGLKVFSVGHADGEVSRSSEHSTVSRIRVSVPIVAPVQIVKLS